jgi:enoyl-CoA hydratase/carnithine racemase
MDGRMHTEFRHLLQLAENDSAVRVAIITGEGDDFCVGADSQALEGHIAKGGYDPGTGPDLAMPGYGVRPEFDQNFAFMMGLETITVAAINGAAAGVGLAAACYCDLRFASEDAKLTTAHGPLGLPPEFGLSWLLPHMIGLTRANDLLLSSRIFLASEIVDWGLFNAVVPGDQLMDTVIDYTNQLLSRVAPSSLKATKRHVYLDQHRDVGTAVANADIEPLMREPDYKEGVAAFIERRPAVWPDRI